MMMKPLSESRIFIAEDNFMYSYILEQMLKEYGNFKITSFAKGEECAEMLHTKPDVVILDYTLETPFSGGDVFEVIRNEHPNIPVIMLSGQTNATIEKQLRNIGLFEYIQKGDKEITFDKLLDAVLRALHYGNMNVKKLSHAVPLVNPQFVNKAMRNNRTSILNFIDIFLDQFPEDMNWVTRAVQSHDLTVVLKASRHMRSTVSLMGIERMEKILLDMETLSGAQGTVHDITMLHVQLKEMFPVVLNEMYRLKLKYS